MSAPDHAELIHAKKIAADIGRFVARGAQVTRAAFTRAGARVESLRPLRRSRTSCIGRGLQRGTPGA